MYDNTIYFDIETAPYDPVRILADADPFDPDSVKLGNRKDPEKIAQYIEEERKSYFERILDGAALSAMTGTVLVIGAKTGETFRILEGDERKILEEFWGSYVCSVGRWVGFNIFRFDLPFLIRRSWHLGVAIPVDVFDGRYFDRRFVDLMAHWGCGDRTQLVSLDRLARFLGLGGKEISGKEFARLWESDRARAESYLKNDIELTAAVAKRIIG